MPTAPTYGGREQAASVTEYVKSVDVSGTEVTVTEVASGSETETTINVGGTPRGAGTGLSLDSVNNELDVANPFTDADATKLDGIETDATADQTAAEIKTLYESNSDTNAFTDDDETKLDGIESGADVNPKHVVRFRSEDGSSGVPAGTFYFIKSDNTQWQAGAASENLAAIEFNPTQFSLKQNPNDANDNPGTTDWRSLLEDIVVNDGATVWLFYNLGTGVVVPSDPTLIVLANTIVKNEDGNYVLQNLVVLKDYTIAGTGYNWQIAGSFAPISPGPGIVGIVPKNHLPTDTVYSEQLEGRESDRYASYNNALIGSGYRTGDFCLFNQSTGVPVTANAYGQPDIANGTVTWAFGAKLRTDRDPNNFVAAAANVAADYVAGDVIHLQIWNKPKTTATLTLTSGGTLVGAGDAAYIYGVGTLAGITDAFDDVADNGDYFLIADEEPSDLRVELPATDILDPPWVEADGSNVTAELIDAIQGDNEEVTLTPDFRVDVTNVDYYIQITEASKQISIRMPSSQVGTDDDEDAKRLLQPNAWVEIGGWKVDVTTNANRSVVGSGLRFSFNYGEVLEGLKPTGSATRKVTVVGADIHRGEVAKAAFAEESPSIGGKGGTAGQVWTRGSDDEDADWADTTPLPVETSPTVLGAESPNNTWTVIHQNCGVDDRFVGNLVYSDGSNSGFAHIDFRFGDLDNNHAKKYWFPIPASSGARVQLNRNGTNLRAQKAGPITNMNLRLRRYADWYS